MVWTMIPKLIQPLNSNSLLHDLVKQVIFYIAPRHYDEFLDHCDT